jgi:restriction system protein
MHSHPAVARARFNPIAIATLSPRDFERLIGEAFRERGFQVTGFGSRGAEGAADLALVKTGERFLVQFKHWRKHEVGVLAVRELKTALDAVGAQGGYVLTAGEFTREAREFVRRTRIELIGGRALIAWLRGGGRERRPRTAKAPARAVAPSARMVPKGPLVARTSSR